VLDGGVAGAAMEQPFANNPSYSGHLNWDPDEMTEAVSHALARNWRIATHAVGDRTVRTVLDVYERALEQNPTTPPGTLVVEHAFLADQKQRARAIALGISITQYTAIELYTSAGTRLTGEAEQRGTLEPHRLADFVADRADPVTAPVDDLPSLTPAITCVGGRGVHDPDTLLEPATGA
jgi:predicted amidohydrolase YtcJ